MYGLPTYQPGGLVNATPLIAGNGGRESALGLASDNFRIAFIKTARICRCSVLMDSTWCGRRLPANLPLFLCLTLGNTDPLGSSRI
jgi:hypothetical protein